MIPLKGIFLMLVLMDGTIGLKPMNSMKECRDRLTTDLATGKFKSGNCLEGGMIMSPSIMDKQIDLLKFTLERMMQP